MTTQQARLAAGDPSAQYLVQNPLGARAPVGTATLCLASSALTTAGTLQSSRLPKLSARRRSPRAAPAAEAPGPRSRSQQGTAPGASPRPLPAGPGPTLSAALSAHTSEMTTFVIALSLVQQIIRKMQLLQMVTILPARPAMVHSLWEALAPLPSPAEHCNLMSKTPGEAVHEYVISEIRLAVTKMSKGMKLRFFTMEDWREGRAMRNMKYLYFTKDNFKNHHKVIGLSESSVSKNFKNILTEGKKPEKLLKGSCLLTGRTNKLPWNMSDHFSIFLEAPREAERAQTKNSTHHNLFTQRNRRWGGSSQAEEDDKGKAAEHSNAWHSHPVDELPAKSPWMMTAATRALFFPRDGGLKKITGASCLGWPHCNLLPLGVLSIGCWRSREERGHQPGAPPIETQGGKSGKRDMSELYLYAGAGEVPVLKPRGEHNSDRTMTLLPGLRKKKKKGKEKKARAVGDSGSYWLADQEVRGSANEDSPPGRLSYIRRHALSKESCCCKNFGKGVTNTKQQARTKKSHTQEILCANVQTNVRSHSKKSPGYREKHRKACNIAKDGSRCLQQHGHEWTRLSDGWPRLLTTCTSCSAYIGTECSRLTLSTKIRMEGLSGKEKLIMTQMQPKKPNSTELPQLKRCPWLKFRHHDEDFYKITPDFQLTKLKWKKNSTACPYSHIELNYYNPVKTNFCFQHSLVAVYQLS
ncbi:hypothetical protein DV515_00000432, partial [Chloebia gouldiae]